MHTHSSSNQQDSENINQSEPVEKLETCPIQDLTTPPSEQTAHGFLQNLLLLFEPSCFKTVNNNLRK